MDKSKLKELALKAGAEAWDFDTAESPFRIAGGEVVGGDALPYGDVYTVKEWETPDGTEPLTIAQEVGVDYGRFIAAANPTAILELLDEIERLSAPAADVGWLTETTTERVWECKIGFAATADLPRGADAPMRNAVAEAFQRITGSDAQFCFSGWGGKLTELERAVIENRLPKPEREVLATRPSVDLSGLTEKQISAAGRMLANRHADTCGVDRYDNWMIYGDDFIAEAKAALSAVLDAKAAQPAVPSKLELEREFLEDWLSFAADPIGSECCGQPVVGAQYGGMSEQVCCGNPEPAFIGFAAFTDAMSARHKDVIAELSNSVPPVPAPAPQPTTSVPRAGGELGSVEDINRIWTAMPAALCNEPFVKSLYKSALAAAHIARHRQTSQTTQGMADCMDMVRQELIEAGIIDKSVPPMMIANAVVAHIARQDQAGAVTWKPLSDSQWVNIVNHDHAYENYDKEGAVHEAVKRTEAKLKELNAAPTLASAPQADDYKLRALCAEMVKLHKDRGTVLTIHMEALEDILAAPIAQEGEQSADLTTVDCPICNGHGLVGGRTGQTPESYEEVTMGCDECDGQGKIIVSRKDLAAITAPSSTDASAQAAPLQGESDGE